MPGQRSHSDAISVLVNATKFVCGMGTSRLFDSGLWGPRIKPGFSLLRPLTNSIAVLLLRESFVLRVSSTVCVSVSSFRSIFSQLKKFEFLLKFKSTAKPSPSRRAAERQPNNASQPVGSALDGRISSLRIQRASSHLYARAEPGAWPAARGGEPSRSAEPCPPALRADPAPPAAPPSLGRDRRMGHRDPPARARCARRRYALLRPTCSRRRARTGRRR